MPSLFRQTLAILSLPLFTASLSTVVYGPQNPELLLLTAKLAAKAGIEASCICASGREEGCRRLMYGKDYVEAGVDQQGNAKPISSGEDIQDALQSAESLVMICYDDPLDEKSVNTLVNAAGDDLKKIVLLSKMGASKKKTGFFAGSNELYESEQILKKTSERKGLALSIVRAGILKGGGPGDEPDFDYGLDQSFYNTRLDAVDASVTMAHDKYTLGAACSQGDTIELPNMMTLMGTKSSFDPCEYDSNRVAVAGAVVASILADKPLEFSVSSASAVEPLSMEQWKEALEKL